MTNSTLPVNGGAIPAPFLSVGRKASVDVASRSAANDLCAKLLAEAHARTKADFADALSCRGRAHHVDHP
ncbi:hypothetical protein SAMN05216525_13920 [Bradyrhizobium sp. Gha]|nr:hypothetical protein SAMN05216525_13920 [Bradyrhizobium sp. Gha]